MARTRTSEYREPRTFMGHPLTPQPQPLSPAERRAATARIEANDEIVANPALLAQLIEANRLLSQMASRSRPARHRVLFSGTAQLDSTGVWSKRAGDGIGSGALWVYSPNVPLIVIAGTRQAQAPNFGAGVFLVPAATELTLNARATEWTLYGDGIDTALTVAVPQPALGAQWSYTVPASLTVTSITATLTTSAANDVAIPQLNIVDPAGNVISNSQTNPAGQAASTQRVYQWGPNLPQLATGQNIVNYPIPPVTLLAGSKIFISEAYQFDAGDQWAAITITGTQIGGTSAQSAGAVVDVTMYSDPESGR